MQPSILASLLAVSILTACSAADSETEKSSSNDVIASADPCEGLTTSDVSEPVRSFMAEHEMIGGSDEQDLPDLGISMRWEAVSLVPAANHCLVVMNVVTRLSYEGEPSTSAESVANDVLVIGKDGPDLKVSKFEDAIQVPEKVRAIVGTFASGRDGASRYFAELTGPSAVDALKSVMAKRPYSGFSGVAVKGTKAAFDSTPGRNWQIVEAEFSLRRGHTGEALDIYAYQLDAAFEDYFDHGVQRETALGSGVQVSPWDCRIDEILE
jgi:hypothetical protein